MVIRNPRQRRAIQALVSAYVSGRWISREDMDDITKASNSPEVIRQIRNDLNIQVMMRRFRKLDADGRICSPGRYKLNSGGYLEALSLLKGAANDEEWNLIDKSS